MKEKDIINLYRQQMENHSEQAPEGLWDDIANELDIADVWGSISAELDQEEKKKSVIFPWLIRAAVLTGIVSMLGIDVWLGLPDNDKSQLTDNSSLPVVRDSDNSNESGALISDNFGESFLLTESAGASVGSSPNKPDDNSSVSAGQNVTAENAGYETEQSRNSLSFAEAGNLSETLQALPAQRDLLLALQDNNVYPDFIVFAKPDSEDYALDALAGSLGFQAGYNDIPGTFSLGLSSAVKNTWMFNSETFDGLNRLNHNRTGIRIYPDLGISMQYLFSPRWGIESDIFFASVTGQLYNQYIHGKYTERNISLRYFQTELLASYTGKTFLFRQSNPMRLKSMAGIYSSRLYNARETIGNQQLDVRDSYQNMDFGLIAGQHVDFTVGENFIISPGFRVKWGLSDIYTGSPQGFSSLSNTHNRSFEFRLNVYYRFSR